MAKLEDLFRRSLSETPPPATPPPGQWERIRQGVVAPTSPPSSWWKFAAGVVVGMLLMGIVGWVVFVAPAPLRPEVVLDAVPTVVVERTVVDTVVRWRVDTVYLAQRTPLVTVSHEGLFANLSSPSILKERFSQFDFPEKSEEVWQDARALANSASLIGANAPDRVVWSQDYDFPSVVPASQVRVKLVTNEVPATLGWKGFTRVKKPDRPAGRWEIGLHVTPEISSNIAVVNLYSEKENDFRPAELFELDDREVTLYYQQTDNAAQRRLFKRLLTTHISLSRQFSNGLRVGVGLNWYNHRFGGADETELLPLLFEGEYYTYSSGRSESLQGTLSVGYTFFRRRRMQLTLGALARAEFQSAYHRSYYIFSRDDRQTYFQDYTGETVNGRLIGFDLLPQLSLHYHLNDRLSVGTEIVPGLGLGARYKF